MRGRRCSRLAASDVRERFDAGRTSDLGGHRLWQRRAWPELLLAIAHGASGHSVLLMVFSQSLLQPWTGLGSAYMDAQPWPMGSKRSWWWQGWLL
jgi:hypothetical protein